MIINRTNRPVYKVRGVILDTKPSRYRKRLQWTTLFLEQVGIISLLSKNFMGNSMPCVWGYFYIQKRRDHVNYFVLDLDVKDNMSGINRNAQTSLTVTDWTKTLITKLVPYHCDNKLLSMLYWNMKLLTIPAFPPEAVDWRFKWRLLHHWGLAPEISRFLKHKAFNHDEKLLLAQMTIINQNAFRKLLEASITPCIREGIFRTAAKLARHYFHET